MSSDVFSSFSRLWRPNERPSPSVRSDEDIRLAHEQRMALVHDVKAFIATQAYKDFREWLEHQIEINAPDPALGSDVAACYTFKREGLMVALRRLDTMVKLAEERISDAS